MAVVRNEERALDNTTVISLISQTISAVCELSQTIEQLKGNKIQTSIRWNINAIIHAVGNCW
nr:MAG: hypothetical protein EDM05_17985 [Leptolyngbya sp. IPPAS B-1204]